MLTVPPEDVLFASGAPPGAPLYVTHIGLFARSEKVIDRMDLSSTFVVARVDEHPVLKLVGHDGRVVARLAVADLQAARALRDELQVADCATAFTASRPVSANFLRSVGRLGAGVLLFAVLAISKGLPITIGLALFGGTILVFALVRYATRRKVVAGDDGFAVGWMVANDFVPYASIYDVVSQGTSVEVLLHSGAAVSLVFTHAQPADAFVEHVNEHRALFDTYAPPSAAEPLALRGQAVDPWRAALVAARRTGNDGIGYRTARREVDVYAMWSVVEHPFADPAARAGAAIVLAPSDDEGCARLRAASARSACLQLRRVFERVAEGDSDPQRALRRLAAELCDEDRSKRRA